MSRTRHTGPGRPASPQTHETAPGHVPVMLSEVLEVLAPRSGAQLEQRDTVSLRRQGLDQEVLLTGELQPDPTRHHELRLSTTTDRFPTWN